MATDLCKYVLIISVNSTNAFEELTSQKVIRQSNVTNVKHRKYAGNVILQFTALSHLWELSHLWIFDIQCHSSSLHVPCYFLFQVLIVKTAMCAVCCVRTIYVASVSKALSVNLYSTYVVTVLFITQHFSAFSIYRDWIYILLLSNDKCHKRTFQKYWDLLVR